MRESREKVSFTVNSFLLYLRLTVKMFQFFRLSTKFLAVLRLSVNPLRPSLDNVKTFPRAEKKTLSFSGRSDNSLKSVEKH